MKETRSFNRMLSIMMALSFLLSASAQEKNGGNGLLRFAKKITSFIDTMAINGIDPNYISTPQKPWQVIAKSVVNQSDMKMKSTIDGSKYFEDVPGEINWSPLVGIANLYDEVVEFVLGLRLCLFAHPCSILYALSQCLLKVADNFRHALLA